MMKSSQQIYHRLFEVLGYEFSKIQLLEQALTHRSANKLHNERLEFLGDAVLGLCVAQILYEKFPLQAEGKLTRMRSNLVKGETLAAIAREIDLGALIKLGAGEMKSGGRRRDSILADALEAILGAIYLESGFEASEACIKRLFANRIEKLDPNVQIKDSKTQLQEYLQSRQLPLPNYEVIDVKGEDHAQTFEVRCSVESIDKSEVAQGRSRRIAEQKAAKNMLAMIQA